MLIDELKQRMFAAMKAKNTLEKELLRTVIGDVTATGDEATDERVVATLKKTLKGCKETLELTTNPERRAEAQAEVALLEELLPKGPSLEQITAALGAVADAVRAAGNDGQATGIAMKHLKASGLAASGKEVADAVKLLRK